jgi:hypothetical protein
MAGQEKETTVSKQQPNAKAKANAINKSSGTSFWAVKPLQKALWDRVRVVSGTLPVWMCGMLLAQGAAAAPLQINVVGVNQNGTTAAVTNFRWTVEEDVTKASVPGAHATRGNYSFSFHASYMPVVAAGRTVGGSVIAGNDCTDPNSVACMDPDRAYMPAPDLNPAANKRYYVSVLPDDGYAMGAAPVEFDASGNASATIYVNQFPVPTAQISIFAFDDNSPINGAPDLPQEEGLPGFTVLLTEAGGTYGGSGGQVTQDAFGNPLGTVYQYDSSGRPVLDAGGSPIVVTRGSGIITTGPDGVAVIKNLFPAKYTVQIIPPAGSDWHQTSTIEGGKGNDAWVKNNEPSFFQEFGPPGHHVFIGFTRSGFIARNGANPVLNGSTSVTGRVTNIHNSRPPDYRFYSGNPMANCWVGLNEPNGGRALYAAQCNPDSTFAIPNVPAGTWELVVWDEPLDNIIASATITVPANTATHDLGDVPVFSWFGRYEGRVFYDANGNGFPDPGEVGIADQAQNIRFRDGSIYQSTLSAKDGTFSFKEVFPFFNWMIAEVDYARFKATGATVVVDAGGPVPAHSGWTMPSFNRLNPQPQSAADGAPADGAPYRTETGVILLEGMQTFLGQTNHIEWGKQLYAGEENGGIAGIVQYGITRAEDDPKNGTAETWEPGIPRVQINLFLDCDGDGKPDKPSAAGNGTCEPGGLSGVDTYSYDPPDVDNFPFCWRDPASCGLAAPQKGPEDRKRSRTGGVNDFSYGDVFTWGSDPDNAGAPYVGLSKTDSWDDALPAGCRPDATGLPYRVPYGVDAGQPLDCYDGLRNWNQVRPAVFDGGYAFGSVAGQTNLPNVKYILEAVAPPGYFHQGNGDKNVVFGDTVTPAPLAAPYECVGMTLPVPPYLTLFPAAQEPNILYTGTGQTWRKCDMKLVDMQPGRNAAPNFFLYTEAPVAGHGVGFILDDMSSEFDVNAPTFGEKHAPPWLPVSINDWTGREISRVYADEFGSYNFLVPSTFTINPPFPSGVGPSMMVSCMNSPGPIKDQRQFLDDGVTPNPTYGQMIIDPYFNRQYSQFCYTLQYLPGKTTYLDTPVVPVAAFPGRSQNPLDCELANGTPMIYSVSGPAASGPYLPAAGGTLTLISAGSSVQVPNPYYDPAVPGSTKTIVRDYGFGAAPGSISLGGVPLTVSPGNWTNDLITVNVPANTPTGQLTVTRANGIASSVGVTVTVGGSAPKYVPAGGSIQATIDSPTTTDGDLVIVPPGVYNEYVIMDKKIRLQGWGALSTTINAAKIGTAGLKNWRTLIDRKIDAQPSNPPVIDPDTGLNTIIAGPARTFDLLPGQTLGTNISNNEPLLFGAEEGPGILVVGKQAASGAGNGHFNNQGGSHARIDGLTITGADAGGGILASGYVRSLEVSNNRILSNYGTYAGGVRIGHNALLDATNAAYGGYTDSQNGCVETNCSIGANIHHNWISQNGGTEAGAGGGVMLGNGATNYRVAANYVCGNFSTGDGGGIGHLGLADGGVIDNNKIIFNQTFNQSANVTGGGIFVGGAVSLDGSGLSPGTGDVTISANLIQGNNAGAGGGAGVSLRQTNGLDVFRAPSSASSWNSVSLINNMIVNNVAGYAGGGVSMVDALRVSAINNTVANNDSTATNQEALPAGATISTPQPAGIVSHATNSGLVNTIAPGQRNANLFSNATLANNIIWHNRSFCWAITGPTPPNNFGLFDANSSGTGCNVGSPAGTTPVYRDLAVMGVAGTLTSTTDIVSGEPDPLFVSSYFNGNRQPAPIIPGATTLIDTAATVDEGGNFIEVRYGPLTRWNCPVGGNGQPTTVNCPNEFGDYHLRTGSPAINAGNNAVAPATDYDLLPRARSTADPADIGADETTTGTGSTGQAFPALSVIDNFNRNNANALGNGWQQLVFGGTAGIRVNGQQAYCTGLLCALGANAYRPTVLGAKQAAAFTFANTTMNNASLLLKGNGNLAGGAYQRAIRVRYNAGQVIVETTTNYGFSFPSQWTKTIAGTFASGDTMTALVDAAGNVFVWRTSGSTTTLLGQVQLATTGTQSFITGTGRIGLYLPSGARVDNFAGGTVTP